MTRAEEMLNEVDPAIVRVSTGFCSTRDLSEEDAEDIAQDARLTFWEWARRNEGAEIYVPLAVVMTQQAARDHERKSRRHRDTEELPLGFDQAAPDHVEYEVHLGDILEKIVNNDEEAAVAMSVIYQGLTVRETAEHLGLRNHMYIHRILHRLRQRAIKLGILPAGDIV